MLNDPREIEGADFDQIPVSIIFDVIVHTAFFVLWAMQHRCFGVSLYLCATRVHNSFRTVRAFLETKLHGNIYYILPGIYYTSYILYLVYIIYYIYIQDFPSEGGTQRLVGRRPLCDTRITKKKLSHVQVKIRSNPTAHEERSVSYTHLTLPTKA